MTARRRFGYQFSVRETPPLRRVRAAGRVASLNAAFRINLVTDNKRSAGRISYAAQGLAANCAHLVNQQPVELSGTTRWKN